MARTCGSSYTSAPASGHAPSSRASVDPGRLASDPAARNSCSSPAGPVPNILYYMTATATPQGLQGPQMERSLSLHVSAILAEMRILVSCMHAVAVLTQDGSAQSVNHGCLLQATGHNSIQP